MGGAQTKTCKNEKKGAEKVGYIRGGVWEFRCFYVAAEAAGAWECRKFPEAEIAKCGNCWLPFPDADLPRLF